MNIRSRFAERMKAAAISRWELAALLGIHPHLLPGIVLDSLRDQPVRVLLELARRLDLNAVELLAALDPALAVETAEPATATADSDVLVVLAALYIAHAPLSVDDLAEALGFDLDRTAAALDRAATNRHLTGPMAVRRHPGGRYALAGRLDLLTEQQRTAITERAAFVEPLDPDQAAVLLAVVAYGNRTTPLSHAWLPDDAPDYREWCEREDYLDSEQRLKAQGLIRQGPGRYRIVADDDVLYGFQYNRTRPTAEGHESGADDSY